MKLNTPIKSGGKAVPSRETLIRVRKKANTRETITFMLNRIKRRATLIRDIEIETMAQAALNELDIEDE